MKVLFVAAESVPFIKTGGLADVIGSLPKELINQGVDARVILPKYGDIDPALTSGMKLKTRLIVRVGWRNQYCDIWQLILDGVTFYFVDNKYYFGRSGVYGFYDDAERYTFFGRAVLETLPLLDFQPDVLHCHDWHTGMVSVFLDAHYKTSAFYQDMKTIFTIHNLQYQGVFPKEILTDLLDLSEEYFHLDGVEFYGGVSFMKGGLMYSDWLTTVSKTYAKEIQDSFYGAKLDGVLRKRSQNLTGILNGIDYQVWNPATDGYIAECYDSKSVKKKQANKSDLQKRLGLDVNNQPLIAMVSRLVSIKGFDLVAHVLQEMLDLGVQLVILGTGESKYEQLFTEASKAHPNQLSVTIGFDNQLAHQIYAGSDMFLMPSLIEPCGLSQLIALRYGSVPIVRETGGLKDTVQAFSDINREGNGFTFYAYNAHEMLGAIQRAIAQYRKKLIWRRIVASGMECDYSWHRSAQEYIQLYQQLTS